MSLRALLSQPPYSLSVQEKIKAILPIVKSQLRNGLEYNANLSSWFSKIGFNPDHLSSLYDVPFLPTRMFKHFDLHTVSPDRLQRVLRSSSTTSQVASKVPLDKETIFSQSLALSSILQSYLGVERLPFIIFDHPGVSTVSGDLTARGAGVRGLSVCAKECYFIMLQELSGDLSVDWDVLNFVSKKYSSQRVYGFGFTFIVWSVFINQFIQIRDKEASRRIDLPNMLFLHSGGWKKLHQKLITKDNFDQSLVNALGLKSHNVRDFYGLAEQGGLIFVDCEFGFKHVPNFASVRFLNPYTLVPVEPGETGMIQIFSALAASYYGQSILTEDLGRFIGVDDCPCGRKGERFLFHSRVEKTEVRGCGDTFRSRHGQGVMT